VRSTTCTSLALLAALAGPASAAEPGCYARDYTDAHLAAHPDQIVRSIMIRILAEDRDTGIGAWLWVTLADQGYVKEAGLGGTELETELVCGADRAYCGIECDGGTFDIAQDGDALTLTTSRIIVGGGCETGYVDLAEHPDTPVSYRLTRAPDTLCPSPSD
jgi:hypothetical protein